MTLLMFSKYHITLGNVPDYKPQDTLLPWSFKDEDVKKVCDAVDNVEMTTGRAYSKIIKFKDQDAFDIFLLRRYLCRDSDNFLWTILNSYDLSFVDILFQMYKVPVFDLEQMKVFAIVLGICSMPLAPPLLFPLGLLASSLGLSLGLVWLLFLLVCLIPITAVTITKIPNLQAVQHRFRQRISLKEIQENKGVLEELNRNKLFESLPPDMQSKILSEIANDLPSVTETAKLHDIQAVPAELDWALCRKEFLYVISNSVIKSFDAFGGEDFRLKIEVGERVQSIASTSPIQFPFAVGL